MSSRCFLQLVVIITKIVQSNYLPQGHLSIPTNRDIKLKIMGLNHLLLGFFNENGLKTGLILIFS